MHLVTRIVSRLEARLRTNIGNTLSCVSMVFMRLAITALEVNRFGRNLGHSEYIVCSSMQKPERKSEAEFFSGKQRAISPTSRWPNFTRFAHMSWIGEIVNSLGTEF